jgi:hypothetical protein
LGYSGDQAVDLFFGCVTGASGAYQSFGFESEALHNRGGVEISMRQEETSLGETSRSVC